MALATYSDLKTTIANYLARSDLTSQIPDFITLAENRLRRELRTRKMLTFLTTSLTANQATLSLPSDFLQLRDIHLASTPVQNVQYLSPSLFFRNARTTDTGSPTMYTILSTDFQFAPIPDSSYSTKILYYAAPTYLSDSNTSNVFLANYPDALIYAALGEAEPYLMNDERLQLWAAMYQRAIDSISSSDEGEEYSGVPLAMTVSRK
jgi:hypothetical protein